VLLGAFLLIACVPASGGVAGERVLKGTETLGHRGNAPLYSVSGISVDGHGNIFVTDILEYAVKKFDPCGRLVARTGRRGSGPGEFRAPTLSVAAGGRVVVVQVEDPRIEIFDTGLVFREEVRVSGGLPVDLAQAGGGAFAVALCGDSTSAEVLLYRPGRHEQPARLRLAPTGCRLPLYAAVRVGFSPGGRIVAAYLFLNRVEIYSRRGRLLRRFAVDGMPCRIAEPGDRRIPEETYFRKVLVDTDGSIILLGGNQGPHPGRDLFICSSSGNVRRRLVLPSRARTLSLGGAHRLLAASEDGTAVIMYNLEWN